MLGLRTFNSDESENFFKRKMKRLFQVLDTNGDGVFRLQDLLDMGSRFKGAALTGGCPSTDINQQFTTAWNQLFQKDGQIQEVTLPYFTDLVQSVKAEDLATLVSTVYSSIFCMFDADKDGFIQIGEFCQFLALYSSVDTNPKPTFHFLDTDKDGKISEEEFVTAFKEFLLGEDPTSQYGLLFGPLED